MKFFNVSDVSDLDAVQLNLAYWIDLYESLNEMLASDKPEQKVIEDDYAFDKWLSGFGTKKKVSHTAQNVWGAGDS